MDAGQAAIPKGRKSHRSTQLDTHSMAARNGCTGIEHERSALKSTIHKELRVLKMNATEDLLNPETPSCHTYTPTNLCTS